MNEFIEQFIIESRELVEQGSAALVILEKAPHDTQAIDELFRALHTLKGSAGIVDFAAMEGLLHEVEGTLSMLKSQHGAVSGRLNAHCFACLDLVGRWLDAMERSGTIPAGAAPQAAAVLARFSEAVQEKAVGNIADGNPDSSNDWPASMLAKHPAFAPQARSAVRFTPKPDCFFRGEDPLALISSLPGLLALDLQPHSAWPQLDTLDPFESFLVVSALSTATTRDCEAHLKDHAGECDILPLDSGAPNLAQAPLSRIARELLEAQVALLADISDAAFAGIVASAGTTAANALSSCGQRAAAERVMGSIAQSLDEKT